MPTDTPIDETLRLARDLCLGVGAFFVTPAGTVFSNLSDVMRPDDAETRVTALARGCLTHPSARGATLFWSAETADESGGSPDSSLACVVATVWAGPTWLGLLGVVDVWLPELDEEQRAGLVALAQGLSEQPVPIPAGEPAAPARRQEPHAEPFVGEILDNLPDGLVVTRADGTIVLVNQTFASLTGLAMDAVLGEDVSGVLVADGVPAPAPEEGTGAEWPTAGAALRRQAWLEVALGQPEPGRTLAVPGAAGGSLLVGAAGRRIASRFAGECFVTLVREAQGAGDGVTDGQQLGIQQLLDHIEDGIVCCDATGTVVVANRAARRLHGLDDGGELVVGAPFPTVTGLRTPEGEPVGVAEHPLLRSVRENLPFSAQLVLYSGSDGGVAGPVDSAQPGGSPVVHVAVSARPLRVDGGDGAIAVLRDVTAEEERQQHLTHYALHDPLTGVANRYLLIDALDRMLDGLARRGGYVSLVYLDLDFFKVINDEHGHDTGDEVLRAVAHRLERAVRGEDVVARLGGDEFVVAHVTSDRLSDGDAVVARIRKVLSAPYRFGGIVLDVGASVGWVSAESGADTPESLITRADRAMYEHKRLRRASGGEVPA